MQAFDLGVDQGQHLVDRLADLVDLRHQQRDRCLRTVQRHRQKFTSVVATIVQQTGLVLQLGQRLAQRVYRHIEPAQHPVECVEHLLNRRIHRLDRSVQGVRHDLGQRRQVSLQRIGAFLHLGLEQVEFSQRSGLSTTDHRLGTRIGRFDRHIGVHRYNGLGRNVAQLIELWQQGLQLAGEPVEPRLDIGCPQRNTLASLQQGLQLRGQASDIGLGCQQATGERGHAGQRRLQLGADAAQVLARCQQAVTQPRQGAGQRLQVGLAAPQRRGQRRQQTRRIQQWAQLEQFGDDALEPVLHRAQRCAGRRQSLTDLRLQGATSLGDGRADLARTVCQCGLGAGDELHGLAQGSVKDCRACSGRRRWLWPLHP